MDVNWEMLVHTAAMEMMKIFVPVIVVLVVKWIVEIIKKLSEKNPAVAELIAYAAKLGYAAAEDYFRNNKSVTGETKMAYAIHRGFEYLANVGVTVDHDVMKDAITDYGVNELKFHWTKKNIAEELFGKPKEDTEETGDDSGITDPEEGGKEEDHEPGSTDHLCVGDLWYDHNAGDHQNREQPAGSDQSSEEV